MGASAIGVAVALGGGACTVFNGLGLPPGASVDAGGSPDAGDAAQPGYTAYLPLGQAAMVCSLVFQCSGLPESITQSIGLAFSGDADPANYSLCVDVLAGPIDPGRPGLATQRAMLAQIAGASSCGDAASIPFVREVFDAGCPRPEACVSGAPTRCSGGAVFQTSCESPLFGDASATCVVTAASEGGAAGVVASCNHTDRCGKGSVCAGNTIYDCEPTTGTNYTYDCSVTGRLCGIGPANLPRCQDFCLSTLQAWDCKDGAVRLCRSTVQSEYGCTPAGGTCKTSPAGTPYCEPAGASCSHFGSKANACSGSAITLCVDGSLTTFDCSSLGAGQSCREGNAVQGAHCGP